MVQVEGLDVHALAHARSLGRALASAAGGPTQALNGHLDHLRGCALGIRNLHNYIHRSLLDTGGFRPRPQLVHAGPLDEWRARDGSFASSARWFLGDDNACQRRGALDGQGSWIHDRDTLVALELCTDTSPARAALLGIDPTSGAERWRVSVPGFDAWAAGLDGPVPALSSSPWPVTFHSLPSSAPTDEGGTDEGETAEGGADKDGPSAPTDPGTDAFEVVVDGVGHRIATSTGEILQTQG